jgi:hypothetical protein
LGAFFTLKGHHQSAEPLLRWAVDEYIAAYPNGDSRLSYGQVQLAECLTALGRFEEAEPYLVQAFDWLHTNRGLENSYAQEVGLKLIELYDRLGRPTEADRYRLMLEGLAP